MSVELLPSYELVVKKQEINSDLQDSLENSGPIDLMRVWPEPDHTALSRAVAQQRKAVDQEFKGQEANLLHAQFRAIEYLYGNVEETLNEKGINPLGDIIALIANIGDRKSVTATATLASDKKPESYAWITRVPKSLKPEQRTEIATVAGVKEYRTISRFYGQLSTVIRGLHVLGEAAKHHPLIIATAVQEYTHDFTDNDGLSGTAMGLLEMLHNLNLTYDQRFYSFSSQLREIVLEEVGNYEGLKAKYSYTVVDNKPFWYQGEIADTRRSPIDYAKGKEGTRALITRKRLDFDLPEVKSWQLTSKKRAEMVRKLRQLTLLNSIRSTALDFSEEKAIAKVKGDRLRKADLRLQKWSLEKKEMERLVHVWRDFIEREIDEGSVITGDEIQLVGASVKHILRFFSKDETLSQKARTNINAIDAEKEGTYYRIKIEELAKKPLFSWVLSLRNPYVREGFRRAINKSSESVESFYLLLKVMTYEVLKGSLGQKEKDFLFDTRFGEKVDENLLIELFGKIEELAKGYVPDVREIVTEALLSGDSKIEDLLSEDSLKEIRRKLEKLTYKKLYRIFRRDKSRDLTEDDQLKIKHIFQKLGLWSAYAFIVILMTEGGLGIADVIEQRILREDQERREEEQRQTDEQRAEAEAEAERLRQEAERLRQIEERAIQQVLAQLSEQDNNAGNPSQTEGNSANPSQATSLAAESARIPGEMGDRIPDAIRNEADPIPDRERRFGLVGFGRIYHLPESMRIGEGDPVGYFPWDINLSTYWGETDLDTSDWFYPYVISALEAQIVESIDNLQIVESIDNLQIEFQENQLAYALNGVNSEMYPPIGWRIVAVYQEGGTLPSFGPLGEIYYGNDSGMYPARALLVLEPITREQVDPKIQILSGVDAGIYWPEVGYARGEDLNSLLSGDPILQDIHARFLQEMEDVQRDYNQRNSYNGNTRDETLTLFSEIGIRYATEYAQYTANNRYYALGFQPDTDGRYATLRSLSEQPEQGYFCSTAAFAFRDFMVSAGFVAGNQPGIALYNYQGYLWGGMGHMNSLVALPDGRVFEADMTPYVTERTPGSDLEWLTGRIVTSEDIRRAIEIMTEESRPPQQQTVMDDRDAARTMLAEFMRIQSLEGNPNYLSEEEFNGLLQGIDEEAERLVRQELDERRNHAASIDAVSRSSEEIEQLRGISANVDRIRENQPTIRDIYLERASGDDIYAEYRLLLKIYYDANTLIRHVGENDVNRIEILQELGIIRENANRLSEVLYTFAGDLIIQAQDDARLLSSIQQEYLRYYQRTGRFPGDPDPLDAFEEERTAWRRNNTLWHSSIDDSEFELFDTVFMERLIRDAHQFIRKITFQQVSGSVYEPEILQEGPDPNDYNGTLETQGTLIARHIKNNEGIYDQLSRGSRSVLENIPSIIRNLGEMVREESGLSPEQQLIQAREIVSDLEMLDNNIEEIRTPASEVVSAQESNPAEDSQNDSSGINVLLDRIVLLAATSGVSLSTLTFAYLGLNMYKNKKIEREITDKIEESLKQNRNLSRLEKDIVLSTVGHIVHLAYDKGFPEKAALLLNLLEHYSPREHEMAIRWLTNEGADILLAPSIDDSYIELSELANGKARGTSKEEIAKYFPIAVHKNLVEIHNGNGNGDKPKVDVPFDFTVIYGLSKLLFTNAMVSLHDEVARRLGVKDGKQGISIPYKVDDFVEILRAKYRSGQTSDEVKPLFNSILLLLRWAGKSEQSPVFTE